MDNIFATKLSIAGWGQGEGRERAREGVVEKLHKSRMREEKEEEEASGASKFGKIEGGEMFKKREREKVDESCLADKTELANILPFHHR